VAALSNQEGWLKLTVQDNGKGLPEKLDLRKSGSLGLELVSSLVRQLGANLAITRNPGTTFEIEFHHSS
jgi:two-component sensor histidine kinase